jgi:hypothetical protein
LEFWRLSNPFCDAVSLSAYLPTKERLVQEVIVATAGVVFAAWFISRIPKLKAFVEENSVWNFGQSFSSD